LNVAEYILQTIESQGRSKAWVSEQVDIKYRTFLDKLERNSFTAVELLKLSIVLNIDLEELKEKVEL
jgi:hypothetical protein